jgi:hypothetical protein
MRSERRAPRAIKTLRNTHVQYPYDRDVLLALASFNKTQGNIKAATPCARKLLQIEARYGSVEQIIQ